MSGYLLDTSVVARVHQEPVQQATDHVRPDRLLYRCAIVELEVQVTARSPADYQATHDQLHGLTLDLPVTPNVLAAALEAQRTLAMASQHRGVSLPDLIIAACAQVHGATVLHYDRDYERIAEVTGQPVQWVVPRGTVD